ncbi:MAG: ABC transporter ATP-binding protein [Oligoflexus sp.]
MTSPFKRLYRYAGAWRSDLRLASILSILNKVFDIFPEILIGLAIDVVVSREQSFLARWGFVEPMDQLIALGVLTFFIWSMESITEYGALVKWRNLAQKVQHSLRMDGVKHSQQLSLSWYEDRNTGTLLSILNDDVNQVERFLDQGIHTLVQLFVSSLLIGIIFFYVSPSVAVFAILPVPIILSGGFFFRSRLSERYALVRAKAGELGSKLNGIISGVVTIRAAVAEEEQIEKVSQASQNYILANRKAIQMSSAFVPIIRMGVLAGFMFTLLLGGWQAFQGEMDPASYTVLVFLTQRLLWPFTRFGEILDLYERSMASTRRVLDLIEAPIDLKDPENPVSLGQVKGSIELEDVSFQYATGHSILKQICLEVPQGKFVALVGPTGAGKSTVIKLLLKFYQASQGKICIDGVDIHRVRAKDLRRSIGYVSQDVFLFDGSIAENIRLGQPDASDDDVMSAAKSAEIHDFILSLPDGYQTEVGERGQKLSGGQRQRLAIARGLVGNPPILIFDEATSAVDNETEAAIQRSLEKLAHHKTVIVIAHRLSTIRNADNIYVLDQGKIAESGKHEDLIEKNGLYSRLWSIQTGIL